MSRKCIAVGIAFDSQGRAILLDRPQHELGSSAGRHELNGLVINAPESGSVTSMLDFHWFESFSCGIDSGWDLSSTWFTDDLQIQVYTRDCPHPVPELDRYGYAVELVSRDQLFSDALLFAKHVQVFLTHIWVGSGELRVAL